MRELRFTLVLIVIFLCYILLSATFNTIQNTSSVKVDTVFVQPVQDIPNLNVYKDSVVKLNIINKRLTRYIRDLENKIDDITNHVKPFKDTL